MPKQTKDLHAKENEGIIASNIGHAKLVLKCARKYYARNRARICANKRHRYNLSEPKPFAKHQYVLTAKKALHGDTVVMRKLIECFMSQQSSAYQDMTKCSRRTAIAQVAAHRLISKAMQLRKHHIGVLVKVVRNMCGLDIKEQCDFGESLHSARSEPQWRILGGFVGFGRTTLINCTKNKA